MPPPWIWISTVCESCWHPGGHPTSIWPHSAASSRRTCQFMDFNSDLPWRGKRSAVRRGQSRAPYLRPEAGRYWYGSTAILLWISTIDRLPGDQGCQQVRAGAHHAHRSGPGMPEIDLSSTISIWADPGRRTGRRVKDVQVVRRADEIRLGQGLSRDGDKEWGSRDPARSHGRRATRDRRPPRHRCWRRWA